MIGDIVVALFIFFVVLPVILAAVLECFRAIINAVFPLPRKPGVRT